MKENTENINTGSEVQDYLKVMKLVDNTGHEDTTALGEMRKVHVLSLVESKINAEGLKYNCRSRYSWLRYVAAIVLLLVTVGLSILSYYRGYWQGNLELADTLIKVTSPKGVVSDIQLADGTIITLNGQSTLTYAANFSTTNRCVELVGEAYFDVTTDVEHPFIVSTDNIDVKVVGTRFSLQSYAEDTQIMLTMDEGKVLVTGHSNTIMHELSTSLIKEQQLIVDRKSNEFTKKNVNPDYYTAWRKGVLYFRNISLGDISKQLERKFNVKITFLDANLQSDKYFAQFENGESLEEILDLLSHKNDWKYTVKGHEVEIRKAKK